MNVTESIAPLTELFLSTRALTLKLTSTLRTEDFVVQTAEYASPARWHLGHTTWFFETLLKENVSSYKIFNEEFGYYFNSYYERFGTRIARGARGSKSRPTVSETLEYRNHVDHALLGFLQSGDVPPAVSAQIRLGLEHEMQHQELLVWDIKHLLLDLFEPPFVLQAPSSAAKPQQNSGRKNFSGGLSRLGFGGNSFAYDNEKPAHLVYVNPFRLDCCLTTIGEYLAFMKSGAYSDPKWWLSDGWKTVKAENWQSPLYWEERDGVWFVRDLRGCHSVEEIADQPVSHVSYYEAHAYAKWRGARLATEMEWEFAARLQRGDGTARPAEGNFLDSGLWHPAASHVFAQADDNLRQMSGDVWEWTSSDYAPYPGFVSEFEEYNDKFFVNQRVLRGGSFATPRNHYRTTYRNFFYPHERWIGTGIRCAFTLPEGENNEKK